MDSFLQHWWFFSVVTRFGCRLKSISFFVSGKTRTKDKYRVVYTDQQRVELEKEFYYSRYITIRRKAELASNLGLSERQVKIWFQNRRAKERKQVKKREELSSHKEPSSLLHQHSGLLQQNQHQTQVAHSIVPVAVGSLMWPVKNFCSEWFNSDEDTFILWPL